MNEKGAKNLAMLADQGKTLRLYGIVGDEWDGFTDDSVAMILSEAADLNTVRINSPGGFVHQGMAIHSLLRERANLTIKIDGLAASMGSVIAMAGARVVIARGAMMMIHNPWNVVGGDADEFRKNADLLDKIKSSIVGIYAARTGQEEDLITEMMDAETWLTAEEAVEWGFADEVAEDPEHGSQDLARVDMSIFQKIPEQIAAMVRPAATEPEAQALKDPAVPVDPPHSEASTTSTQEGETMTDATALAQAKAEGVAEEQKRATEIREAVAVAKLESSFADQLVKEGVTVDQAYRQIVSKFRETEDAKSELKDVSPVHRGSFAPRDEVTTRRNAVAKAILHRFDPRGHKLESDDPARHYAGMTLREVAREMAEGAGVDTRGMTAHKVAQAALTHTSSDFPIILENVVGKALRDAYEMSARTFPLIARQSTLPDYKEVSRVQLGEAPVLQKVLEGGEYTYGTIGEAAEKYRLFKYGKILSLTSESIINDDLDAFTRIPALMGASAGQLESQLFWAHFLANPAMQDGNALFSSDHGNLASSGAVISITTIGEGRARMRQQKGLDGEHFISVAPNFLLVPTALETTAEQFVSTNLMPTKNQDVNVFANRLQVIAEPRLDADSLTAWYLSAAPGAAGVDTFEYAYLQGEEGPVIETQEGFDVDGMKVKIRHSFGVKAIDWRGLDKNPGA